MGKTSLGYLLKQLCNSSIQELHLAAPYIKVNTLTYLLEEVSSDVTIHCVTRWRPDELSIGVSDLEIWPLLRNRPRAKLWLRQDLHAKYYRSDNQCLIGSANLTHTALGLMNHSNFELLVPIQAADISLSGFEKELYQSSIEVNESIYEKIANVVEIIKQHQPKIILTRFDHLPDIDTSEENGIDESLSIESWIPSLRVPENLYFAYLGERNKLTSASWSTAQNDLMTLRIPPCFGRDTFNCYVGALLVQMPIVKQVDEFLLLPRRFGAVTQFISTLPCSRRPNFDSDRVWQTLMRWLRYFLPERYSLSILNYSEIFYRMDPKATNLRENEQAEE